MMTGYIHTYKKTQNLVKTIILLVSVVFGVAEVSNMGRYFSLAAYGEGLSSILYGFCPIKGRQYKVKNVVLHRLSTDGSYLVNKDIKPRSKSVVNYIMV
jgi:hypothetical protein